MEVGLLAIVRGRRHQNQVTSPRSEQFAELIALSFLYFAAEVGRRHPVRFVADDEIPLRSGAELSFQLLRARRHVEPEDEPITLDERIAGDRGLDLITRDGVEAEPELLGHLILPLLDKTARRDDQAAF